MGLRPYEPYEAISSINTRSRCVVLFEDVGCVGTSVRVEPGSSCHINLGDHYLVSLKSIFLDKNIKHFHLQTFYFVFQVRVY